MSLTVRPTLRLRRRRLSGTLRRSIVGVAEAAFERATGLRATGLRATGLRAARLAGAFRPGFFLGGDAFFLLVAIGKSSLRGRRPENVCQMWR